MKKIYLILAIILTLVISYVVIVFAGSGLPLVYPPNLTILHPVNNTAYNTLNVALNFSSNQTLVNASYDLDNQGNVSLMTDSELCYQETANVSTACGGLDSGNYSCSGNWHGTNICARTYDGDGDTWGDGDFDLTATIYINYTKPTNAFNSSLWQVKDASATINLTIPQGCWDFDNNKLVLKAYTDNGASTVIWYCRNNLEWNDLRTSGVTSQIFEEAMHWNLSRAENITLNLTEGAHNITIYGENIIGQIGQTEYVFFFVDTIKPTITIIAGGFEADNSSRFSTNNIPINISFSDTYLFQALINITNSSGDVMWNWTAYNLNSTTHNVNITLDASSWGQGNFTVKTQATDDNTVKAIPDYNIIKDNQEKSLRYLTAEENDIVVYTQDKNKVKDFNTYKKTDRYEFEYELKENFGVVTFYVESDKKLHFSMRRGYPLFNVWNPSTQQGNWIDFNLGIKENNYFVDRINDNKYRIHIVTNKLLLKFTSIGGTNTQTQWYQFEIDTQPPQIDFAGGTLTNATWYPQDWVFVNVSAIDINIGDVKFNWNTVNETFDANYYENKTGLVDGNYTFYAWVNDTLGNENVTGTRIVYLDDTLPVVNYDIKTSAADTYYNQNWLYVNVSYTETNFLNITFYLNDTNQSSYMVTTITSQNFTGLSDGNFTFNVTINDMASNKGATAQRAGIVLDTTPPIVNYTGGTLSNATWYAQNWVYVNASASDLNLDTVTFEWNGTNETFDANYYENKTSLTDGNYTFKVYVNDSAGNRNETNLRIVYLDDTPPQVGYGKGTLNSSTAYKQTWIFVNVSFSDPNFKNITFYLNDTNQTSYTTRTTFHNFTGLSNGTFTINVTVYDAAGNFNSTETRSGIVLDQGDPVITLFEPANMSYFSNTNQITFNYNSTFRDDIDNCSLFIKNVLNQTSIGVADMTTTFPDGEHTYYINCSDYLGASGGSETTVFVVSNNPFNISTNITYNSDFFDFNGINITILPNASHPFEVCLNDNSGDFGCINYTNGVYNKTFVWNGKIDWRRYFRFKIDWSRYDNGSDIRGVIADETLCYQETANISNSCGGLDTGLYFLWNINGFTEELIDGDFDTHRYNSEVWVNYTKPVGARNNSLWTVKETGIIYNLEINSTCWDAYPSKVVLRAVNTGGGTNRFAEYQCHDTNSWIGMLKISVGETRNDIYEDAMAWQIKAIEPQFSSYFNFNKQSPVTFRENLITNTNVSYLALQQVQYVSEQFEFLPLSHNITIFNNLADLVATLFYDIDGTEKQFKGTDLPVLGNKTKFINNFFKNVSSNRNISFYWEYNFTLQNGTKLNFNTSLSNQTVKQLTFNTSCNDPILNVTLDDEKNVARLNSSLEVSFERMFVSSLEVDLNQSFNFSNISNAQFCANTADLIARYDIMLVYESSGYTQRIYNFLDDLDANITTTLPLFLSDDGNLTNIFITLFDENSNRLNDHYIKAERFYPAENTYRNVETVKSDFNGETLLHLIPLLVEYRFRILNFLGDEIKLVPRTTIKSSTVSITTQIGEPFLDEFKDAQDASRTLTFDNTTKEVTWQSSTEVYPQSCLSVVRLTSGGSTLYENCQSGDVVVDIFKITENTTDETYQFRGYFIGGDNVIVGAESIIHSELSTPERYGDLGILLSIMIVVTLFMIGIFNPAVGIALAFVGLVVSAYLGLIFLSLQMIILLAVMVGFLLYKMKT